MNWILFSTDTLNFLLLLFMYSRTTLEFVEELIMLLQSVPVFVWKYISGDLFLIFKSVKYKAFPLDRLPVLDKRIVNSFLRKHPKSVELNFYLSYQTLLALYTLQLLDFPKLVTWTCILPNPLPFHLKQFHPILILALAEYLDDFSPM